MTSDLKIMILFASYGDGHIQVSRALKNKFAEQGINNVIELDLFAEAHPLINSVTKYAYIKSYHIAPFLYGWVYYRTKEMNHDTIFGEWFHSFGIQKLTSIVNEVQPDLVINTFPVLIMPQLRKKTGIFIPTFNVITDFTLHHRWVHREIDKYYVATEDLKHSIVENGVPDDRIIVSGIPLRDSFEQPVDVMSARQKYHLDPGKKTVLVMAGAYGVLQRLKKVCQTILSAPNTQIILVCGKNRTLLRDMNHQFSCHPNIRIFGFIEDIHELMAVSSCVLTKPGGITLSEAISANLPIILYRPVPGQEKDNAHYLAEKGAAMVIEHTNKLGREIKALLMHDRELFRMRRAIAALHNKDSAERVVNDIVVEMQNWRRDRAAFINQKKGKTSAHKKYVT